MNRFNVRTKGGAVAAGAYGEELNASVRNLVHPAPRNTRGAGARNARPCRRLIEGMEGQITEIQDWGIRDLAYPIRKQPRGTYVLAQYTARPEVVKELERNLKLADEILRFISVVCREPRKASRRRGVRGHG